MFSMTETDYNIQAAVREDGLTLSAESERAFLA
jgi:hypothetical protein